MYAEMIINIITCVFSVLTYCVRLFGKNIRGVWGGGGGGGGGENYNREPNSPSSTFRWMALVMNAPACILRLGATNRWADVFNWIDK